MYEGELTELTDTGRKKHRYIYLFNDIILCISITRSRFTSSEKLNEYKWSVNVMENQIGPIERIGEKSIKNIEDG